MTAIQAFHWRLPLGAIDCITLTEDLPNLYTAMCRGGRWREWRRGALSFQPGCLKKTAKSNGLHPSSVLAPNSKKA